MFISFFKTKKIKNHDFNEKFLQFDTSLFSGTIKKEAMSFISRLMEWCTYSIFNSPWSDWFLDNSLHIHTFNITSNITYVVRTCYHNYKQEYSLKEFSVVYNRLKRNARIFILVLIQKGLWEYNRVNLIAVCIAVAEVTEEISFIFNKKEAIAIDILLKAADFAYNDNGILYKLTIHGL